VANYALLDGNTLALLGGGWPHFKHAFVRMMVETGKDFSQRSVAQVPGVGPPPPVAADDDDPAEAGEAGAGGGGERRRGAAAADAGGQAEGSGLEPLSDDFEDLPPVAPPLLKRHSSSTSADEAQRVAAAAPTPLRRQTTLEMAARFGSMLSWEASDHPVVVFKMSPRGDGSVDGVDLLSLNPALVETYIDRALRLELEASGLDFAKDWNKVRDGARK
jgi:hypothetical protein